jgi:drug/metabolite transporter (DMT)-like permease
MAAPSRSLVQVHAAVLLFGLAGLFGKWLTLPPVLIVFGRVVFAALALLAAALLARLPLPRPSFRGLLTFAGLGVLLAVHWTTFFQSIQKAGVAVALITFSTFPVFVALLEPALFRERWRAADVLLALLALAGVAILVPGAELGDEVTEGACWGVASGLTFALLSLLNRQLLRRHGSITIALYQDAFAALALLPLAARDWPAWTLHEVALLLILGVLCTAVAHALFIAGLRGLTTRTASMITCLEPVYGTLLAALFLRELPTVRTLLGGVLILSVAFYATLHPVHEPAGP